VMTAGKKQHVGGEATVGPMEEASLPSDVGQDSPASTSGSGLFLRSGERKIALDQGNFLDGWRSSKHFP